jgi:hypothetical protein
MIYVLLNVLKMEEAILRNLSEAFQGQKGTAPFLYHNSSHSKLSLHFITHLSGPSW